MLIDNRQLKSIHVDKVIDIAKVGKTNNYNDLDGIPTEFPPTEHTHPVVSETENGYMSKEEYIRLINLEIPTFNDIKIVDIDGIENILRPQTSVDTLTIKAGRNVIFDFDPVTKSLMIDVDYSEHLDDIEGIQGEQGEKGNNGITYRPSFNDNFELIFTAQDFVDDTPIPVMNLRGERGDRGESGKDAEETTWDNINGKPNGTDGMVVFIDNDKNNKISEGYILTSGSFPLDEEELEEYKNNIELYRNEYIKRLKSFETKVYTINDGEIIQPLLSYKVDSKNPNIKEKCTLIFSNVNTNPKDPNDITNVKDLYEDKLIISLDEYTHNEYNNNEFYFSIPLNEFHNPKIGCIGIVLSENKSKFLEYMVGFSRVNAEFDSGMTEYNNLALMYNFNMFGQMVLDSIKHPNLIIDDLYNNSSDITYIGFKISVTKEDTIYTIKITEPDFKADNKHTSDEFEAMSYNETYTMTYNINFTGDTQDFLSNNTRIGVCSYNMNCVNVGINMNDAMELNLCSIINNNIEHYNPYKDNYEILDSINTSDILKVGRFYRDINTGITNYMKNDRTMLRVNNYIGEEMNLRTVNNYERCEVPILFEPVN